MAETENMYDIWWWVSKVITSCKNINHINSTERLIQNFWIMFNDAQLTSKLQAELDYKIEQLVNRINVNE
jgi:hypothetical protein